MNVPTAPATPTVQAGDPQIGFRFRIVYPDGRQEQMLVDAERALIGSATHCEVRLPPEIAAHEHVEIFAHERAVHFATKPMARSHLPILDNVATVEGRWASGSCLRLGNIQLYVELVSLGMAKAKPPVWALLVAIPAVAIAVTVVALTRQANAGLAPIPEAPAILAAKSAKCPDLANEQRVAFATEKHRVAVAKRERSPFAPQEGFDAINLFEQAAVCYRAAGQAEEAASDDASADALRVKIDEDYRLRRVRLEHAYRTHQIGPAKRELSVLIPMTAHKPGPYTEWLSALDRAANREIQDRGRLAP